jgi:hypothetical protein
MTRGRVGISLLAALVVVLAVLSPAQGAPAGGVRPTTRGGSAYDATIGARDCSLLGRVDTRRGCSRDQCVKGARWGNHGRGAEVCARSGRDGRVYATPVAKDRCQALGRRWISQVNWCASNPDRSVTTIAHAPQCQGKRSTYVTHTETEGHYDECLRPSDVRRLRALAESSGASFEHVSEERSPLLCSYRPGRAMVDGVCTPSATAPQAAGGVLLVGDSIAWRGSDELARLRPSWTIDGYPGRRFTDLQDRIDFYLAGHTAPTGVILELGTNAAGSYKRSALDQSLATLPADTRLMLVVPYRGTARNPGVQLKAQARYDSWYRKIARTRPDTCLADWRSLVRKHPDVLVDGVHPTHRSESRWAHFVADAWDHCS